MRCKSTIAFLASFVLALSAAASTGFPSQLTRYDRTFEKVGDARYVYRFFFDLYDAALYAAPGQDPSTLLSGSVPLHLQFRYHREIDRSIILRSADRMLNKNLSAEERERIADRVERLNAAYVTVRRGDRSSLTFLPGTGTILSINGDRVETISGDDFAPLYFQIWLGEDPISKDLKKSLLGRSHIPKGMD